LIKHSSNNYLNRKGPTYSHIMICPDFSVSLSGRTWDYCTDTKISDLHFSSMIYQQIWRF